MYITTIILLIPFSLGTEVIPACDRLAFFSNHLRVISAYWNDPLSLLQNNLIGKACAMYSKSIDLFGDKTILYIKILIAKCFYLATNPKLFFFQTLIIQSKPYRFILGK